MFDIEIYGQDQCFYCQKAKEELDDRDISYIYYDVSVHPNALEVLKSNKFKTVPQVYVDNHHIGGYNELITWLEINDE